MAQTQVSIANQALGRIGAEYITALDEGSSNARHTNAIFEPTRDEVLDQHDWSFALTRQKLTPVDGSAYPEWEHVFALPGDLVHAVKLVNTVYPRYQIEGQVFLCSVEDPILQYVRQVTDVKQFSPLYTQALVLRLAAKLAGPVKNARQLEQQLSGEYYQVLLQARMQDAENADDETYTGWWTDRETSLEDIMDRVK